MKLKRFFQKVQKFAEIWKTDVLQIDLNWDWYNFKQN